MIHSDMKQVFRFLLYIIDARISVFFFIATVFLFFPSNGLGQKYCSNPPVVNLSNRSGTTCYLTPVTIAGNTFGGSATAVTITSNGHGAVTPSSAVSSPFSFTYLPENNDAGRVVTITITTNNPQGSPCKAAKVTFLLTVISSLTAPVIDNIIEPTCTSSIGSVNLSGLPANADWILTVSPGGITSEGSGSTTTFGNLTSGTYTFVVSVSTGCISSPSAQAEISEQPATPTPPLPGIITAPTCTSPTGSINIVGLPSSGTWSLTRYPGTIKTSGTGTSTTISNLPSGIYNFSVTNEAGCISLLSGDVTLPAAPPIPAAPVIDTIIQPTSEVTTGSVTLSELPSAGLWTIIQLPGNVSSTGSGTSFTVTGLETGSYTFMIKNNAGCISAESAVVLISSPKPPDLIITDPPPVCYPATIDLTSPVIKEGSTGGLTYTYWTDEQASTILETPTTASNGTYYIKGTTAAGLFDIKPVKVTVRKHPEANAGSDQILALQFSTTLQATLGEDESGTWFCDSASVIFSDATDPRSEVSNLTTGNYLLSWIITNGVCPSDTDSVAITVSNPVISTLITPNGDSRNEYFVINGLESLGRTELTVFDRRGTLIFRNSNYDNKWNGVDNYNKPLMNDTYFFLLRSTIGNSYSGYVVIRR
jgi:gliding motility-associated-like protein